MSLRDGTKKMSKSDASDNSRINLTDDADTIAQKIRKAKTDPEPLPSEEKGLETRPEADNLVGIYAALSERSQGRRARRIRRRAILQLQERAGRTLRRQSSSPIASEMKRLVADPGHVDSVLVDGADRARVIADETMRATQDIVGFVRKLGFHAFVEGRVDRDGTVDAACRTRPRRGSMRRFGAAPGHA